MILSPDSAGQVNWSIRQITDHLPSLPVDIVPVSWEPVFNFKEPQTSKYVLLDFMENHAPSEEYNKFWAWVIQNPPILTFKRELKLADAGPVRLPIEFAARFPIPEPDSRETFMARHISVLNWWGYSHGSRPRLHADIFKGMANDGASVISAWDQNVAPGHYDWMTVFTPHYTRKPMEELLPIMANSKVTVALRGNGQKTFRHAECINTLMAMHASGLAWAYPWDDTNSIQLDEGAEYWQIRAALENDPYDRYVACCLNMKNYQVERYAKEYVAKTIEAAL